MPLISKILHEDCKDWTTYWPSHFSLPIRQHRYLYDSSYLILQIWLYTCINQTVKWRLNWSRISDIRYTNGKWDEDGGLWPFVMGDDSRLRCDQSLVVCLCRSPIRDLYEQHVRFLSNHVAQCRFTYNYHLLASISEPWYFKDFLLISYVWLSSEYRWSVLCPPAWEVN